MRYLMALGAGALLLALGGGAPTTEAAPMSENAAADAERLVVFEIFGRET